MNSDEASEEVIVMIEVKTDEENCFWRVSAICDGLKERIAKPSNAETSCETREAAC